MASISNTTKSDLVTPAGDRIPAGVTVDVDPGAVYALRRDEGPVVRHWIEVAALVLDAPDEPEEEPAPDATLDALSDDELRAFLDERGVKADARWGRKRLLVEAEKVKG